MEQKKENIRKSKNYLRRLDIWITGIKERNRGNREK